MKQIERKYKGPIFWGMGIESTKRVEKEFNPHLLPFVVECKQVQFNRVAHEFIRSKFNFEFKQLEMLDEFKFDLNM